MRTVERTGFVPVTPSVAQRLWIDTNRWPTFIDGFGHVVEPDDIAGPSPGSKVVWQSGPAGRGRVTERITRVRRRARRDRGLRRADGAHPGVRSSRAEDGSRSCS